jgi:carotenoid 1,2-hydratase
MNSPESANALSLPARTLRQHSEGLKFNRVVVPGGYAWWYIDALSDDGKVGLTLIIFVGSVFSPYYAWARRRGAAEAVNHCSFNLALYGEGPHRWAMTERPAHKVVREENSLTIGPSNIFFNGKTVDIRIDEISTPWPRRLRGNIRFTPTMRCERSFPLDAAGLHRWAPFAPRGRIEVSLDQPDLKWHGEAYFDSNFGDEPLENGFHSWTWSRASLPDGTVVLYDYQPRGAAAGSMALHFDRSGGMQTLPLPAVTPLPVTGWRIPRTTRADDGAARVLMTLEDGPFYSRSLLETRLMGQQTRAFHESLSLDRFGSAWVQCLLPFRMPRASG